MLYVIIGHESANGLERRRHARPAHLARIRALQDEGRLALAGPMPAVDSSDPGAAGYTGSLVIAEFESLEAARDFANSDPYVIEGVFRAVDVRPFVQVAP
jgi:uncharacterized protein YciI